MPNDNNQTSSATTNGDNNQPAIQPDMPSIPSSFQSGTPNVQTDVYPPQQTASPTQNSENVQTNPESFPPDVSDTLIPTATATRNMSGRNQSPNMKDISAVITSEHVPERLGGKKVIATIFGILFLVGGVAAGVFLAQRRQFISSQAWNCDQYIFEVNQQGEVSVRNGQTRNEPSQKAQVFINGVLVTTFDVPALNAGGATTLGTIGVPTEQDFTWNVDGSVDCKNNGNYEYQKPTTTPPVESVAICHIPPEAPENAHVIIVSKNSVEYSQHMEHGDFVITETPPFPQAGTKVPGCGEDGPTPTTSEPTPTTTEPTPTSTEPTPTLPPSSASCSSVLAYDINWNLLNSSDLSAMEAGDIVRFAVFGTTTSTSGIFDKAQFTVNGVALGETASKKPGTDEFFSEYVISGGIVNFTVTAKLHHSELGWF